MSEEKQGEKEGGRLTGRINALEAGQKRMFERMDAFMRAQGFHPPEESPKATAAAPAVPREHADAHTQRALAAALEKMCDLGERLLAELKQLRDRVG